MPPFQTRQGTRPLLQAPDAKVSFRKPARAGDHQTILPDPAPLGSESGDWEELQGTRVLVWEIKEPGGVALSLPVADLVARGCDLVESGRSEEPLAGSSWTRSGTSCTA